MSAKSSGKRKNSILISALAISILALVLAAVIGIIVTISGFGGAVSSTMPSDNSTVSDISSDQTGSNVSSENTSSEEISSNTPSTETSSVVSTTNPNLQPDNRKVVYLTFDDGPSNNTPELLNVLDELGVKATFFVVGNAVNSYPQYLTEIVNRGHQVALHAYVHDYKTIYGKDESYFADLQKISDLVYNWTGVRSNLLRFPGGSSNKVSLSQANNPGVMTRITQKVQEMGYYYFDWNVDSDDAGGLTMPVEHLVNEIKSYPKSNSICVLMHDTYYKTTTIEALPQIVEYYKNLGYEFDVLSEDSPQFHHRINN